MEDASEVIMGEFATSDIKECADNGAYHVTEETVGSDGEGEGLVPVCVRDGAEVGTCGGVQAGEGGEVVVVKEEGGGLVHGLAVEAGGGVEEGVGAGERVFVGREVVLVGAGEGVETGMGGRGDGVEGEGGNVGREETVKAPAVAGIACAWREGEGGEERRWSVEVGDHITGMDAGIGASGSREGNLLSSEEGEGLLDMLLDGGGVGL
jgi:hypothetical protein